MHLNSFFSLLTPCHGGADACRLLHRGGSPTLGGGPGTDPGSPRHVLLVSGGYGVVELPAEPPLSPLMPTVIILDAERTLF